MKKANIHNRKRQENIELELLQMISNKVY